jgi:hypothetical protein
VLVVIFALHQRVRPFNKFPEWELRRHPLEEGGESDLGLLRSAE